MKKKYPELLVFAFFLIPLLASAQVHLVTSGFNAAGGDAIDNQSFDYSFGELISNPIETNNVKGNIGILQVIPDNMTGIENEIFPELSVSPNPSQGVFEIQNKVEGNYSYSIYDINGSLMEETKQLGSKHTIDLARYNPGVYILSISNGKKLQNIKLIKT
jgi:hypothetical protein